MNLQDKSQAELLEIAKALDRLAEDKKYNKLDYIYPDKGPYRRELYPKHIEFMRKGATHSRRAFIAANRIGKSFTGAYETTVHLTGLYPTWWGGRRFTRPINAWIAGLTGTQIREAVQELLFGSFADKGSGIIPKYCLLNDKGDFTTWNMPGVPNLIGAMLVRHYNSLGVFDGWSKVEFKTYDQGWEKYQGAKRDVIWLDEEPEDHRIYSECATRTAGVDGEEGIMYCTFTPLLGFSDVVLGFMPNGLMPEKGQHPDSENKWVICATWEDVPHLSAKWKKEQLAEYSQNERDARSKGVPTAGSGRVYPILEEDILIQPFKIPDYFPRAYGLDFGWHCTAAIWGAKDPRTGVLYLYSEYYRGKQAPYVHGISIKERGSWIIGAADPSGGKSRDDGTKLIEEYSNHGLQLIPANNAVVSGINTIYNMMESGQLKVFSTNQNWLTEYRTYRYDTKDPNKIAPNQKDHLMDATRYLISIFDSVAQTEEDLETEDRFLRNFHRNQGRDSLTGY